MHTHTHSPATPAQTEGRLRNCMVKAIHDGEFEDAMRDLKLSLDRFIGK
jgi:hypothetical protein